MWLYCEYVVNTLPSLSESTPQSGRKPLPSLLPLCFHLSTPARATFPHSGCLTLSGHTTLHATLSSIQVVLEEVLLSRHGWDDRKEFSYSSGKRKRYISTGIACLAPREPVAQPVPAHIGRSLRQHHVIRATSDVCAHLTSSQLQTAATSLDYIITSDLLDIFNNLNFCICSSQLPLSEDLGLEMDLLSLLIGTTATNNILETAVSEVGTTCTYPSHATAAPVCSSTGFTCGFTCTSPYTESNGQCVCPSPYTTCNGVCGSFPKGCSSSTPQRRTVYGGTKRVTARGLSLTMADAQATCQKAEIVCGVYGGSSVYECVNADMTRELRRVHHP
ncbi:hypothetical protein DAEQUDRAFT_810480 [Daedalea quercina L-15889]|uniref:Uncharacterized protein n=1 Tax=Daedalea quercina L-15889 TaxID=1314783 RepID=A0A165RCR1_9APHY|nr:hypothetical protein DAEQUDRAFT_810480 [Daedalea quercina L-15889]